ncbi:MAG: glycosyltransferase [Candidatus Nealsonbacteria bacterium]|nr:glycosyltransferase [Candidatus Nealsonbacteria bacterium]
MNTPVARAQLLDEFPWLAPGKTDAVTNSFEPSEVKEARSKPSGKSDSKVMLVAHVGTMRGVSPRNQEGKPGLHGRIRRFRDNCARYRPVGSEPLGNSPWFLFHALRELVARHPEARDRIRLVLAGNIALVTNPVRELRKLVSEMGLEGMVEYLGEIPHEDALTLMHNADVLLVNQERLLDGRACPVVAAKTYEYMAMEKPILGLVPPGDTREFLLKSGLGVITAPDDVSEIAGKLFELYQEHTNGGIRRTPDREFIEQFRSDRLARKVWDIFEEVTGKNRALAAIHE